MAKEWAKQFYNSKAWLDCRSSYIASVHGLCETCMAKGIIRPGYIVHHKIWLTADNINDANISLNHDNLRYECQECHNKGHMTHDNTVIREGLRFDESGDVLEVREMKTYKILYQQNGDEYIGTLKITCDTIEQLNSTIILIDNKNIVEFDESIISIE
jgi:hypothetical protein